MCIHIRVPQMMLFQGTDINISGVKTWLSNHIVQSLASDVDHKDPFVLMAANYARNPHLIDPRVAKSCGN